ncbi:hypothetical protein UA08_06864 [Talaromyces atroroseus]|uniref:DUF7582 domain-containing protein n=1 Tax=Talaromyces atroroseus TaxID=1441469 RepID=A0A225ASH1_TALAT|nr:hypothetical protein UA08_06864 [Talaromyces atroroseus]OKL57906.1 hypothetical protein UA08_06864 [Talaromyces atroroseus]
MGNSISQPDNESPPVSLRCRQKQGGNITIGAPQEVVIHVPRNRLDRHGVPIQQVTRDIDRNVLFAALQHVARYISHRGQSITVIAVGGAVNTPYLQSRGTTHDVDVFGSTFTNKARMLLDEAMQDAQRHYRDLGTDWINTETQMCMPGSLHDRLTVAAERQNVKIFNQPGLTMYAAPWNYAFSANVNRILTDGDQARPYDLDDAVTYIHKYIHNQGNRPVSITTALALDWAKQFHHKSTANLLRTQVNQAYRRRYGVNAFV